MLTPMIIHTFKSFIIRNRLMASNLLMGAVLSVYLYAGYLRSHQHFYLNLLEALIAAEGLVVSFFVGLKLKKTWSREAVLKEKEERLKLFTQIMEEAILIREGEVVVEVNDVLARMLGYEISEMIGRNIYQFIR